MTDTHDPNEQTFDYPLTDLVTFRLVRLHAKFSAQAARILKTTAGLTPAQWRVLFMINDHGPMAPAKITKLIGMDKGQLSRTIKSMIDSGMLRSEMSEMDHRSIELSLTDVGKALFEQARPSMSRRQRKLMGSLTDSELQSFYSIFDKLEKAAETSEQDV